MKEQEKLVIITDSHSLSAYQNCEKKYYFRYPTKLVSIIPKLGIEKGTLWHKLMVIYYLAIKNKELPISKLNEVAEIIFSSELLKEDEDDKELKNLILKRYTDYCKHYHNKDWNNLVAVEEGGGKQTGFSKVLMETEAVKFIYEGIIDLIINIQEINIWVDHKTQNPKYSFDLYPYTNQFLGYCWALGSNTGIINYTTWSKEVSNRTFRRQLVPYHQDLIDKWRKETISWYWKIAQSLTSEKFNENRSSCDGKYGACSFTPICNIINPRAKAHIIKTKFKESERDIVPW